MKTSEWRTLAPFVRIRATYGLQKLKGNRYAYVSVTGETQRSVRGKWREDSVGCLHGEIIKAFPELAKFIPWHLMDETGEPMHYAANARYWLEVANFAKNATESPEKAREHFKSTVLWGLLEGDDAAEIPGLRGLDAWLEARLVRIRERFKVIKGLLEAETVVEGLAKGGAS